ncbi:MAG TPA: protein-tyrosine-phosphatase [Ignavibacteria bacterium]|nr:protein-tyrosine-phosphatase [Ignavibacteria bacterium]
MLYHKLIEKIEMLGNSFDSISEERKKLLIELSDYIANKLKEEKDVSLTFICTHNSRRSHISQIWAQTAAEYYNLPNIKCYSGGTEATAFNPRAVKAMTKAGFKIEKKDDSDNPVYLVYYSDDRDPIECFSKVYSDEYNPQKDFAAIMTCSDADANCPVVFGAEARFPIRYDDPKEFDGTELEESKYDERVEQIGREMLLLLNIVKNGKY